MKPKNDFSALLDEVRARLKPDSPRLGLVDEIVSKVNSLLKKARLDARCEAGGSYAKGVTLKDDFDIDLFVRFGYAYRDKDISALLGKAIRPLRPSLVHGSRDYYQLKRKKILFEVIPVLDIKDYKKALNVTDMSPLHVGYAMKRFGRNPGLRDEVRLAKQFCKAAKVYGAESYIQGFSGHVLDLLIIFYGGFEQLLMQASLWGERVVIDIEGHWKDPMQQLNFSKTVSPLVIVDPMQPDRNAAAAVSREKFDMFKSQARAFLQKPTADFFKATKLDLAGLRKRARRDWLVVAKAVPLKGKDDVVLTKILRAHLMIGRELKEHDFKVISSGWEPALPCVLYYLVKKEKMRPVVLRRGPPVKDAKNSAAFRKMHRHVAEKNGVLYASEKRKYLTPDALVRSVAKSAFVKEKVKSISFS